MECDLASNRDDLSEIKYMMKLLINGHGNVTSVTVPPITPKLTNYFRGVLEYRHQNQTHNSFDFKRQFLFLNASEKVLVSLKRIINIPTVFLPQTYVFNPFRVTLVRINYSFSDTSYHQHIYLWVHFTHRHAQDTIVILG